MEVNVYEDDLFIPLVKFYDGDKLNQSVVEMIKWNVRTPDEVIGDIRSQIAANHERSGKMKIISIIERPDVIKKILRHLGL